MAAGQDRQRLLDLLLITSLRRGADGRNPQAPNAANYDESKANPYPDLPDPLVMKNGRKVTKAATWWNQRRPAIVTDFDREIYGRAPKNTPKVKSELTNTTKEMNGDVAAVTKQLVGGVDNSSYLRITVDIQLSSTTPAQAAGPVARQHAGGQWPKLDTRHHWACKQRSAPQGGRLGRVACVGLGCEPCARLF